MRLPVQEVATAMDAIQSDLVCRQDQARGSVAGIADARHVPPGIGCIGGVNTHGIAVDTAGRLAGRYMFLASARIMKNQLIGSQ